MREKINYRLRGNALISLVSQLSEALKTPSEVGEEVGKTAGAKLTGKKRPHLTRDLALIAAFNLSKAGGKFSREELEVEAWRVYYGTNRAERRAVAKNLRSIPRRAQRHRASAGSVTWLSKAVN